LSYDLTSKRSEVLIDCGKDNLEEKLENGAEILIMPHTNRIFVTGGSNQCSFEIRYNMSTKNEFGLCKYQIMKFPQMSSNRMFHNMVMIDKEKFAVVGGQDENKSPIATCEVYNIKTRKWDNLQTL
jgi:hypothetical protein